MEKPLIIDRGSDVFQTLVERMESRYDLDHELVRFDGENLDPLDDYTGYHDVVLVDGSDISPDIRSKIVDMFLEKNDEMFIMFLREGKREEVEQIMLETYRTHSIAKSKIEGDLSNLVKEVHNMLICGLYGGTIEQNSEENKCPPFTSTLHFLRDKNQIAQGYLQLLKEEGVEKEERELLEKALITMKESQNIFKKIDILMELARDCEGNRISLNSAIDQAIVSNQTEAEIEGIEIGYENTDITIKCCYILEYLFENLIENAVKHSEASKVSITTEERDKKVTVTVEDDGKGIGERSEKLFDIGYKENGSRGPGIGLYLVKKIANRCGGDVEAKRSKLGGARFDVTLLKA